MEYGHGKVTIRSDDGVVAAEACPYPANHPTSSKADTKRQPILIFNGVYINVIGKSILLRSVCTFKSVTKTRILTMTANIPRRNLADGFTDSIGEAMLILRFPDLSLLIVFSPYFRMWWADIANCESEPAMADLGQSIRRSNLAVPHA